ncbi:Phosphoserine phosphatase [Trichoplax sp. H2]|uniref:Phosphoserine phosphatase n=1 Tax=Trichoplax adhaerens TaxID=10228 RepID=B3RK08_TRIAD|nr:hypothetical protein TRIADDRAFT_49601 [Trichoplax adhaerens]EDV29352.1 hypothetical protein TRIADDRAFT_49601 [Trichoplax adhaerens]RDD41511.1 Phosphoserine phosphatase [Trichoplax sp. H2]|eukprot:XP_002108554.1 hypothetical protein TRIADDRAFT_49601 [Trichoplax adhaerens]
MSSKEEVVQVWKAADAVCFDVDSTVCIDEGLDKLADYCGVGEQVKDLTNKAMGGTTTFREALKQRLDIFKPNQQTLQKFVEANPPQLTPGLSDVVRTLQERGTKVYLVSGGLRAIIEPVATVLNIPFENIFANRLLFFYNGEYAGFDESQPTSESGGKPRVVAHLKSLYNYKNVVMIGDGATDMEACPPADAFIGFGGNVVREKVKNGAKWFATDMAELYEALKSA